MQTEYSFSWHTVSAVVLYFVLLIRLVGHLKRNHTDLYERFGGRRMWWYAPDQLRFFGFLFGFRYFARGDDRLSLLALSTKLVFVVAAVLIVTQPLYFRATS